MICENGISILRLLEKSKKRIDNQLFKDIYTNSFYKENYVDNKTSFYCILEFFLKYEIKDDIDLITIEASICGNNSFLFELYDNSGEIYLNKCIDFNEKNKSSQHVDDFLDESFFYINKMIKN